MPCTRISFRLPFPKLVEELTINITTISDPYFPDGPADDDPTGGLCPQISDYEVLSRCLQQLREEGALKAVVLDIRMEVDFSEISINIEGDPNLVDEPREQAKLEAGLNPLVQANVLDADFTLMPECENEGTITSQGVMHCSVRRV
ncbi:hypothetical protein CCMSSC00406_0000936 [Pleurotus cornucopiae]|uniref:Uncharacterized protein n=1 Tax=Pleurotus cornucopiae TaxID=5321 RepID=A0ACB7ILY6_PLECO|nr:hypothetical protein CCMSSC00406_0000936 [Pleurotus cornucopiae]